VKVIVVGGGVIGVTSAYYLAKAGCEVTVIERQDGVALETSYANAGEISPGYSAPWSGPGVPRKAIKWLLMEYGPLVVWPRIDVAMWRWIALAFLNCTRRRYIENKSRMVPLAEYSRDRLRDLRAETGIEYDGRTLGTLQLFRTEKQLKGSATDIEVLERLGVAYEKLDADGCAKIEPGLAKATAPIAGGLRLPGDETGDCFMFTRALARLAEGLGVKFMFGTRVERFERVGGRITSVVTSAGTLDADAYVLATGSYSPLMLRPLGFTLPIYPVKGYSLTLPIVDDSVAPVSTVLDETYKVAVTRLGSRIRVGGTAELAGYDTRLRPSRRGPLDKTLGDLFPGSGDATKAEYWAGLRPMTPDGTPIIGATRISNLYLNTGHGTLGWTMSCGSGRVLADIMTGQKPEISTANLGIDRYGFA
jgi:D-amino-acid dehydrogenase